MCTFEIYHWKWFKAIIWKSSIFFYRWNFFGCQQKGREGKGKGINTILGSFPQFVFLVARSCSWTFFFFAYLVSKIIYIFVCYIFSQVNFCRKTGRATARNLTSLVSYASKPNLGLWSFWWRPKDDGATSARQPAEQSAPQRALPLLRLARTQRRPQRWLPPGGGLQRIREAPPPTTPVSAARAQRLRWNRNQLRPWLKQQLAITHDETKNYSYQLPDNFL